MGPHKNFHLFCPSFFRRQGGIEEQCIRNLELILEVPNRDQSNQLPNTGRKTVAQQFVKKCVALVDRGLSQGAIRAQFEALYGSEDPEAVFLARYEQNDYWGFFSEEFRDWGYETTLLEPSKNENGTFREDHLSVGEKTMVRHMGSLLALSFGHKPTDFNKLMEESPHEEYAPNGDRDRWHCAGLLDKVVERRAAQAQLVAQAADASAPAESPKESEKPAAPSEPKVEKPKETEKPTAPSKPKVEKPKAAPGCKVPRGGLDDAPPQGKGLLAGVDFSKLQLAEEPPAPTVIEELSGHCGGDVG